MNSNKLVITPKSVFSNNWFIRNELDEVIELFVNIEFNGCRFCLDNRDYKITCKNSFKNIFELIFNKQVIAKTNSSIFFTNIKTVVFSDYMIDIVPNAFGFNLISNKKSIGKIASGGFLSNEYNFEGLENIPLKFKVFIVWLVTKIIHDSHLSG